MRWIKRFLQHKILALAIIGYIVVFLVNLDTGMQALGASKYYFIEMIQILPPIFILTSLIQTWVPTKVILNNFGDGTGIKGKALSFAIGSLSAGPIYAAFPICGTLIKKGASIDNIVIILSTWAVVKVPMLINEVKFMGAKYMVMRWVLTTVAIFVMAYVMKWWVKRVPKTSQEKVPSTTLTINQQVCVKCGRCISMYPHICIKEDTKIMIKQNEIAQMSSEEKSAIKECCSTGAIQ